MKKVTVVVPTYNVEVYIAKCLDSLVAQTSNDFEVLVVNDGSPYNEQPIIDSYTEKYKFIHCLVKENGNYGDVLEKAIARIKTEYMLICDPDDTLYPNAIEELLKLSEDNDIVIGAKTLVYSDNEEQEYDKSFNANYISIQENKVYEKGTIEYEGLYFIDPSPHSKLYRVSMLKDFVFPHKVSFTDNVLFFLALNKANKVVYTSKPYAYYLIDRAGNTMTDVKIGVLKAWRTVELSILEQSEKQKAGGMLYYRMFETFKFIFNDMVARVNRQDPEFTEVLDSLYDIIRVLNKHADAIWPYYQKYNKSRVLEQMNDKKLIYPSTSQKAFNKLKKKYL